MGEVFFSSDLHLSHNNILAYDNRPFANIDEHNEALIANHNALVNKNDLVFWLGDICMGHIVETLPLLKRFNGMKYLIPGNHDRVSGAYSQTHQNKFWNEYERYVHILPERTVFKVDGIGNVNFSHYPYDGDHTDSERYMDLRFVDTGKPLVHGHIHAKEKVSYSSIGTKQVHVGVTSWEYRPVHIDEVRDLLISE